MTLLEDRVALADRVKALEERAKLHDDREAILRTIYAYSYNLDHATTPDEFADCFTESALWWSSVEGTYGGTAGGLRLEGRPAIAEWFMASGRGTPAWKAARLNSKHYIVAPNIVIDGDRATAVSLMLAIREHKDGPYIHAMGRYYDELVRCPDGRWRFQQRHLGREGASVDAQARRIG